MADMCSSFEGCMRRNCFFCFILYFYVFLFELFNSNTEMKKVNIFKKIKSL